MITRRKFLKAGTTLMAGTAVLPHVCRANEIAARRKLVLPTPAQVAWQNAEVGIIYHFDLATAAGDPTPNNAARKTWDPNLYQPQQLDTDQWLAARAIFTLTA